MHGVTPRRKANAAAIEKRKPPTRRKREGFVAAVGAGQQIVRLTPRFQRALARLEEKTGRPQSYHIRKALERYIEDTWDYLLAVESAKASNETISLDELRKKLGLDD